MGMALGRDNGDYFGVSYSLWAAMLELAEQCGWRPAGTDPPTSNCAAWNGSYYSSDGQRCREEDAWKMAGALERFLVGELPSASNAPYDEERERLRQFTAAASSHLGAPLSHPIGEARDWLGTADGRKFLRTFVQFCRGGAFELW